jgi:hypothetical protein
VSAPSSRRWDLNPEIRNVSAERIEWDLPELVFIAPYAYQGFSGSVGQENPLQVYAAAGIVVRPGHGGTLVPLYLVQNKDRITAMTIAAGSWSREEYYWPTRKGREAVTLVRTLHCI